MDTRMTRRFFTCHCGHKVRFLSAHCGICWAPTPLRNRGWVWVGPGLVVLAILLGALISLVV